MNICKFVTAVMLVTGLTTVAAENSWTLEDCVNYALEHNLTIKSREIELKSGELAVTEAKSNFLPQISANASQSFNFGRGLQSDNTYADRNVSNFQWGAQFSLPLFQGLGNVRRLKYSRLNLQQMLWQLESAKDDVTLNVISRYLQVLYCMEVKNSSDLQVELSEYELSRRRALAEAGKIAEVEILDAEAQLSRDRLASVNAANDYTLALLELAQLLQLQSIEDFSITPVDETNPVIPTPDSVYASAKLNNNTVKASQAEVVAADANISVAKSGYIPRLSFNGGVGSSYYNISGNSNPSFSRQMRDNYNTYIGFSLSIPIFDGLNTANSVRRAKIQKLNADLRLDQVESDLYKAVQQAYYQAIGAREKYTTSLDTEKSTGTAFSAMQEKYNLGRATSSEYEQSKTTFYNSTLERIQAHYEYLLRYRILMYYQNNKIDL